MSTFVLAVIVGIPVLFAVATAIRRPEVRRLATRAAGRRPTETVLVALGILLGTAIITGSLVVGDSLRSSLQAGAFTQLGPVDETVTAPGADSPARLRRALAGVEDHPEVEGLAIGLRSRGTVGVRMGSDQAAVHPDVQLLQVPFDAARELTDRPETTGLDGAPTPPPGQVAMATDLAKALDATTGDRVTVFAHGREQTFEVGRILPRVGLAGFSTDPGAGSHNLFLPPGALDDLVAAGPDGGVPAQPLATAFVSNEGDVLAGADHSDRVTALLEDRVADLPQAEVTPVKQQRLDTADQVASRLSEIFLGLGTFAVLAGVLLLVNVFVMLAAERRSELGTLRAVGMQRPQLVRSLLLEGTVYGVPAAALGSLAGLGVGAAIIQVARGISGGPAGFALDLTFAAEPRSLVTGLLVGLLISLLTIAITSVRISRLNIIRAIRELPEPSRSRRPGARLVLATVTTLVGTAATITGAADGNGVGLLLGPAIGALGLGVLAGQGAARHRMVPALGLAVTAWGLAAPSLVPAAFRDADVGVFVVQGLVVTGAAVVVLARHQSVVGRLARALVGGGSSVTARLGLAYPLARPFRTTMTMAMYALVVFTLVLVSVVAQVFGGQAEAFADAEGGGYDLLATSTATDPLPAEAVRSVEGVTAVAPLRHAGFDIAFRAPDHDEFRRWFASGYDQDFLHADPPALDRWVPDIGDEQAVWQQVLDDPSTMIVGSRFLQEGGSPQSVQLGDVVEVRDAITGQRGRRQVVGVMEGGLARSGAFMSAASLDRLAGRTRPANRLYVAVDRTTDAQQVADRLEQDHLRHGVQAETFDTLVARRQQQNHQFLRILQGYLLLGLVVGTAGLGVVMIRAVRDRRQQIGVLRSVGLQTTTVRRAFMLEAAFTTLQGILVGGLLGGVTAYQLVTKAGVFGDLDVAFQVPWAEVTALLATTLVASIAAASWPAHRASRIRPAVAVRTAE